MNKKGIIFSLDLVFALVLFVALLGLLFQFYNYGLHQYKDVKINSELDSYINLIENELALNENFSCDLVNKDGEFIKYISYCVDSTKFNENHLNLPGKLKVSVSTLVPGDFDAQIEKKFNLIIHGGSITKAEYYDCIMGNNCNLQESEIVIGVSY